MSEILVSIPKNMVLEPQKYETRTENLVSTLFFSVKWHKSVELPKKNEQIVRLKFFAIHMLGLYNRLKVQGGAMLNIQMQALHPS